MMSRKTLSGGHGCVSTPHVPTPADTSSAISARALISNRSIDHLPHSLDRRRHDTDARLRAGCAVGAAESDDFVAARAAGPERGTNDSGWSARHRTKSLSL